MNPTFAACRLQRLPICWNSASDLGGMCRQRGDKRIEHVVVQIQLFTAMERKPLAELSQKSPAQLVRCGAFSCTRAFVAADPFDCPRSQARRGIHLEKASLPRSRAVAHSVAEQQ